MKQASIRNRLVWVGVVIVAAIIGASGLIIEMQRRATIDAFLTATSNLVNGMSQQTTQSIGLVDRALRDIQASLATDAGGAADIASAMRRRPAFDTLVDQRKRLSGVTALLLVDAGGQVANASDGLASAGLSARDVFTHFRTVEDHAVFVGAPAKDPASGRWTAMMARRIDDSHGGFAGLVAAELSLTDLQEFYHLAMPARRSVYVARSDGVVLVRYPPADGEIGRRIPAESPWYAIVAQGGGTYHAAAYFDRTLLFAAVRPLRTLPLVIEASVTEADTFSEWYRQRIWVAVGCVAAIVCVIGLLRLFGAQYRRLELSELSLATKNAELDIAHRQLDATLSNLSQGVCFFDRDRKLVVYNQPYCALYDLPEQSVRPGMSLMDIAELRIAAGSFDHTTIDAYRASVEAIVRGGSPTDAISKLHNGRTISRHFRPLPDGGWVMTHEDITERCAAEEKIAFLARYDGLTGLANRVLFHERLDQAFALADRGKGFAVMCLDLDRFKAVNDTFGHPTGDSLLRAVAGRLRDAVRESDTVARLGGDEFAILQLGVSDAGETTAVAERIVQTIQEIGTVDGHEISVGTSIGIAIAPGDSAHPVQLMKCADLALYRSKQEGRGTWRFFEPAMDAVARTRRALEAELKNALPSGQFELHYQPLVCGTERTVTGFETLLRWRHPTRGLVPPADFVSVAEEIGIIAEIGAWVLHQACAEAVSWPGHIRVAVNLSTRQFRGRALVTTVADALRTSGLAPERLELEITESVPLQEDHATLSVLHDLRSLGTRVALDDFGTGYSSLSYLRGFPFDAIKIDRSFVNDLQARGQSAAIIHGIIGLAASLHMSVTAEGVETDAQFAFLAAAGCTEMQGYLISKPVSAQEVPALLERLAIRDRRPAQPFAAIAG